MKSSVCNISNNNYLFYMAEYLIIILYRTLRGRDQRKKVYFKFHKVHSQPANCFIDHKECFIAPQRVLYSFNKALFAVQ